MVRTPQVPGSRPVGTVLSTDLSTGYHHNSIIEMSIRWCVWEVGEGFHGRVLPKTSKWVAVYYIVVHQWIAVRQVGPVSLYCDGVGSHVLCLRHGIPVWQYIGQSITATSRYRHDVISDV